MREFEEMQRLAPVRREAAADPRSEVFVSFAGLRSHGINYTRVHIARLVRRKLFPAAVRLSANRVAWRMSDLARWKASRMNAM